METATVKRGRFGREESTTETKEAKPRNGRVQFKLLQSHEAQKPRDKETGQLVDNPYPDIYYIPNAGVAVNPKTKEEERWRYLSGYSSIWVKDQTNPYPSESQLNNADGKNDLKFDRGSLFVRESDKAKLDALMIQDIFDGVKQQVNPIPFVYTLIDHDVEQRKVRSQADEAFEAESLARKASFDEMLAVALAFGIDIQNAEADEEAIRTKFIFKAKENPSLFTKVYNDPKNKVRYLVTKNIQSGMITISDGVLHYNGVAKFQINQNKDVAEQVGELTIRGDKDANKLYDTLRSVS